MKNYRIFISSALVFIVMTVIGILYIEDRYKRYEAEQLQNLTEVASSHSYVIERQLTRSLSATYVLASIVKHYGKINNFNELASEMILNYDGISSLQLAKNGVVSNIYPLAGNEKAIGHDLLNDPKRRTESLATIKSRSLTLAGPFELIQGGMAVIGRLPVFMEKSDGTEYFWGFTIALIRLDDLIAATNIPTLVEQNHAFELSRIHPDTNDRQVFAHSSAPLKDPSISFDFNDANGKWTLTVSHNETPGFHLILNYVYAFAVLIAFALSAFTYSLLSKSLLLRIQNNDLTRSNDLLNSEIEMHKKTADEMRLFRNLINHSNDAIFVINPDSGEILDINDKACNILGYEHSELLGMNIQALGPRI